MRWPFVFSAIAFVACGAPASEEPAEPAPAPRDDVATQMVLATPRWLVEVPLALVDREGATGLVVRITNRADTPLLVDLRSSDRVFATGEPSVHMPLTDEQRSELARISALTSIGPHETIEYAVPASIEGTCEGARPVSLSGVLVLFDGDRVQELIADGTDVMIPCDAEVRPLPQGTRWVTGSLATTSPPRALETFGEDMPPLVRAASVDPAADVSLLAFSYDARPIERFRYDACVALGRCPERVTPQPAGSLRSPAVGMSWEGAEAFCATRGLHVASTTERRVIADQTRAALTGDASSIVLASFACVRAEAS